jgi:hypothetical protein
MYATIATMETAVRSLVNEKTASFWEATEIPLWLKEGLEDIAHETHCLRTWKTYTILAADIFDSRELRFDSDHIAIDEGKIYYNDVCCYPTTEARLSNYDGEWRSRTGTPSHYYVRGDMYGFDRQISAGDTIKFYHIERAVEISGNVAPFNGDYRLINFRRLAIWYAVSMCWYKKSEDTKGDRFRAYYDRGVEKMKELLGIDLDGVPAMIPTESLSHYSVEAKWPDWL